ncbi:MAG: chemotaxis protein CheV [Helicobacteraceae bacterium]|jgi:two-component system chemotaxis response regulator CheV|nr:chemotaxis protein CheV [Helicobacteraceae bacterium]
MNTNLQKIVSSMTESHLNNIMQLAFFYTGNMEIYAVNVSKVQNFVILNEIEIVPNRDPSSIIIGVADIRGEVVTFVDLDKWLGMPACDPSVYSVGVVCNVNFKRIGFFAREIIGIEDRFSYELKKLSSHMLKILYETKITIGGRERPGSIFDIERLMSESGFPPEMPPFVVPEPKPDRFIHKKALIAEDSATAAKKLADFFGSLNIEYEIYGDGAELIDRLDTIDPGDIGMIVTDLEMPMKDGFQVIAHMKQNARLSSLPVIVNSSMTSSGIAEKIRGLGVTDFVNKSDTHALFALVERYMKNSKE